MTIAACYVTPEGVVLGADSTSSHIGPGGEFHFYNHNQKLFQIGEDTTLGLLTWNLSGLGAVSYRTLIAQFADLLKANPSDSVTQVAERWVTHFWDAYTRELKPYIGQCKVLAKKKPYDPAASPPDPDARTKDEESELELATNNLSVGFCIAGYMPKDRNPEAYSMWFGPLLAKPTLVQIPMNNYSFWGAPNMIIRLIFGADERIKGAILASGKWGGTDAELQELLDSYRLGHNILPIRDAIDFIHACIYSTIKALKFSNFNQICGGPIELAVITTDRKFRWVWHKDWDAAINEGDPR